ncbi:prolyl oligopeptidase family serine peptidase [Duganella sp. FT80W]|uniref:Prolyl oligopeptidase family serine peptidase n=1 Tax=Duganella guangzhouensis TaxID=2666084 RepID=A0A6I2L288_9BURK|nr:prolyl oligopeptidase family serine peptidase [Duganella guangzhouensis]MRW92435.1 prolyl oligopeptidase family serine peptidase [Duganella guangzhouensis]
MRDVRLPLVPLLLLLASCGGGGSGGSSIGNTAGGEVVTPTPPVSLRGQAIGSAAVVPVTVSSSVSVNTLDPAVLKTLVEANTDFGSAITGTPTCAITTYTLKYHTIDSTGADTSASTAIMVPSGTNAGCQGARPVLLYAHGTSVLTSTDMANLSATEPRLIAALFAAQGYIVVAPNYVGYAGSTAGYHPYLDATEQAADMIDALRAARTVLQSISGGATNRLLISGYSQGGFVAMATQRAMQTQYPSEFTVTAVAPLSGPYALTQFGDAIFNGAPTTGSAAFIPMLINAGQRAGAKLYTSTSDIYEAKYASGIDTLLPGTQSLGELVAAGKLPDDVLFAADSLPQASGYASFFGADHLIKTSYRDAYLTDLKANPCNTSTAAPLSCAPAQSLRKWLLKNDLRTYAPNVPMLLCGGDADPLVPYANTTATAAYMRAQGGAALQLSVLDVDDVSLTGAYLTTRAEFAAAKALLRQSVLSNGGTAAAADQAVKDAYHAGLVAPFCLREARAFLDSAPTR